MEGKRRTTKNSGSYKDYTWRNRTELASQLGVTRQAITKWLEYNKGKTVYDYIDRIESPELSRINYPTERVRETNGEYRNLSWINLSDLGRQLGVSRQFLCRMNKSGELKHYLDRKLIL